MKKIISIVLFLLLALSLTCCGKQNEASEDTQALTASKWFDSLNGDEMIWDGVREIQLDEFPARPNKTTRVEVIAAFSSESKISIRVIDRGFGDFFPETGKMIRQDFQI